MQKTLSSTLYHNSKSAFTVLLALFLACCFTGCHQLESLEMKQLALQSRVDNNTEMLDTILDQIEEREQAMMAAMGLIQQEQYLQLQAVQDKQGQLDKAMEGLQYTQETLQLNVDGLSVQYANHQEQVATQLDTFAESQSTLEQDITELMTQTDTLQAGLVTVTSDQTALATVFDEDRVDLAILLAGQQETTDQLQEMATLITEQTKQSTQQSQQLQDLTVKVAQQDSAWADTLAPIRDNTQQVAAILATLKASHAQVEKAMIDQKDQLSQALVDLQDRASQWQDRLTSMQQDIQLLRSDTLSLDERMNQLQAVARKD